MRARRYLDSLLDYYDAVERQKNRAERLFSSATNTVSVMSDMPKSPSRDNQAQEKRITAYADCMNLARSMEFELEKKRSDAIRMFSRLSRDRYEDVLYYRYIEVMKWTCVAHEMNISEGYAYKLHDRAVKELETILADEPDTQPS